MFVKWTTDPSSFYPDSNMMTARIMVSGGDGAPVMSTGRNENCPNKAPAAGSV